MGYVIMSNGELYLTVIYWFVLGFCTSIALLGLKDWLDDIWQGTL